MDTTPASRSDSVPRTECSCLRQREADRLTGLDRLGVLYQVAELAAAVLTERGAISPAAATTGPPST